MVRPCEGVWDPKAQSFMVRHVRHCNIVRKTLIPVNFTPPIQSNTVAHSRNNFYMFSCPDKTHIIPILKNKSFQNNQTFPDQNKERTLKTQSITFSHKSFITVSFYHLIPFSPDSPRSPSLESPGFYRLSSSKTRSSSLPGKITPLTPRTRLIAR